MNIKKLSNTILETSCEVEKCNLEKNRVGDNQRINILGENTKRKYNSLSPEKKEMWDRLNNKFTKEDQLIPIKKSKEPLKTGDIFVYQPKPSLYFYGQIIEASPYSKIDTDMCSISNLVFFFRKPANRFEQNVIPDGYIDYDKMLIEPSFITDIYWKRGYFYNIGSYPVDKSKLDIGLFNFTDYKFYDISGNELDHTPKQMGIFAFTTITGISNKVNKELLYDESLFNVKD